MHYSISGRRRLLRHIVSVVTTAIVLNGAMTPWLLAAPAESPAMDRQALPLSAPHEQSGADPLVFAFYYTWFDENTWSYDQLSDLPAEPYVSRDRSVMGRHIDQAKAAGIDAFLVAWYGPSGESNQTEPNLAALLEEAAARNFKIGILFETDSPFLGGTGAISGALQHALGVHASHPAFLRVDGRPVIFFWRPTIYGVETWRAIRSQVDAGYGSFWVAEGVDTSYLAVFDGHHLYSNTWNPPADLNYTNQKFAGLVEQGRQAYGAYKYWVATVMPGYNDLRIRPVNGFARDREGGAYYERAWQAAMASNPNWIVITSFNEWPEGTYIEPSAAFGGHFLNLTAAWSNAFRAGGGQATTAETIVAAAAPLPTAIPAPTATPYPEPSLPTVYVQTALLNLREGPGTDGFAIIGQVAADSALVITGRDEGGEWWRVATESGHAWLSGAYVYAAGPLSDVPLVTAAITPVSATDPTAASTVGPESSTDVPDEPLLTLLPSPTPTAAPPTYRPKLSRNP